MKTLISIVAMVSLLSGCTNTRDLATTLRYADNRPIGVNKIKFIELENMKRGKACTLNILGLSGFPNGIWLS